MKCVDEGIDGGGNEEEGLAKVARSIGELIGG